MSLKDKADKKLKRYLNSICEDKKEPKIYNSIHYYVTLNSCLKHIRFSDHISNRGNESYFIQVIKVDSNCYQIWFDNSGHLVCSGDTLLDYVKDIFFYPISFLIKFMN